MAGQSVIEIWTSETIQNVLSILYQRENRRKKYIRRIKSAFSFFLHSLVSQFHKKKNQTPFNPMFKLNLLCRKQKKGVREQGFTLNYHGV